MINRIPAVVAAATLAAVGIAAPAHAGVPGGRVSTTVVDSATGQPVAAACVVLIRPGQGGLPDGCGGDVTDERGRVTTDLVGAGTYQMFVYPPEGYGYQWVGADGGTGDQREAARIRVRTGEVTRSATVRLDPPGTISGVVRDPAGAPAPEAIVAIYAWHFGVGPGPGSVRADEEGRYTIDQLGPYSWPLSFTSRGDEPRQWSGGVANRFQAEHIAVQAGQETTYDMNLVGGSLLRGALTVRGPGTAEFWRLTAVNTVTGDPMGVADSTEAGDQTYEMPLAGPQQVWIEWDVSFGEESQSGWWENGEQVRIPRSGVHTLDLTVND